MKSTRTSKRLAAVTAAAAALMLAGCGSLHDERYNWCQGQSCEAAPVVKPAAGPAPKPIQKLTLSADALFEFDRSGLADMLPGGKLQLDRLAESLRASGDASRALTIRGHTDRLGSAAYNERLSLQRASSVRAYLQGAGVRVPMQVEGVGEREPVSGNACVGNQPKASLIACLQPDRRVEVDVEGAVAR